MNVRREQKKMLRSQEKASKKIRKQDWKDDWEIWDYVLPDNYEFFLKNLKKNNPNGFSYLLRNLYPYQKQRLYHELNGSIFYDCLMANQDEISQNISIILPSDLQRFFNNTKNGGEFNYYIFRMCDDERKEFIVSKILSQETIISFAAYSVENDEDPTRFLEVLLKVWKDGYEGQKAKVFQEIALLPPKDIAALFDETDDSEIVCSVLEHMEAEKIVAVCQHIANLYELIEKSDFSLLSYAEHIPVWDLDAEEWWDLYDNMSDNKKDIRNVFPIACIFQMYHSVSQEDREEILFLVLEISDFEELYEDLSYEEKLEMLDMINGYRITGQYTDKRRLDMLNEIINILSNKEKEHFEKLYLDEFRDQKFRMESS